MEKSLTREDMLNYLYRLHLDRDYDFEVMTDEEIYEIYHEVKMRELLRT